MFGRGCNRSGSPSTIRCTEVPHGGRCPAGRCNGLMGNANRAKDMAPVSVPSVPKWTVTNGLYDDEKITARETEMAARLRLAPAIS